MRVRRERLLSLSFLVVITVLLNAGSCCKAAFLLESNSTFSCQGRLEDCLIAEEDLELLGFTLDSYVITRMLGSGTKSKIDFTKLPHGTPPCGPGQPYGPCMKGKTKPKNCNILNRECRKP